MVRTATLGIDLGGSRLKGVVAAEGEVLLSDDRAVNHDVGAEDLAGQVAGFAADLARAVAHRVVAAGVGVPGAIDPATGVLAGATPHVPAWADYPVRDVLAARIGLPLAVDNDANCAALAELRLGAARGARTALVVTVGTGVGSAVIDGGTIVRGSRGGAGEIGHLPIGTGEVACRCGVPRCVEPDMSGEGLARIAAARRLPWSDAPAVFAAAALGERVAVELVARLADRLGAAIAIAAQILDPGLVVVGGGVAAAGEPLFVPLDEAVARYAPAVHARGLRIVPAEFGRHAGALGAALLAAEEIPRSTAAR